MRALTPASTPLCNPPVPPAAPPLAALTPPPVLPAPALCPAAGLCSEPAWPALRPRRSDGEVTAGWATLRGKRPMNEDTLYCQFHVEEAGAGAEGTLEVGAFGVFDG